MGGLVGKAGSAVVRSGASAGPGGVPRRSARGRVDYLLRLKVTRDAQPVAVALIEAKSEDLPPGHGLEQAKGYAQGSKRLNVPFVFASNGHRFVEYDRFTGLTAEPRPIGEFPTPSDLRARYEKGAGFKLDAPEAKPLLQRYPGGEATRRYHQDAAIRAVLESREVFEMPEVVRAGGLKALKMLGRPEEILRQTKGRLFAA